MANTYSLAKEGERPLSRDFRVREFACRDGSDRVLVDPELVALLQKIREHFGKAVTVNSGYRTEEYNRKVGGASKSQHLLGTAADIAVADTAPLEVARYAERLQSQRGGIGLYQGFTHVDVRAKRTRWDSRSGKEKSVPGFFSPVSQSEQAALWAQKAWDKAVERGIMDGREPQGPVSREMLALVLQRMGLL